MADPTNSELALRQTELIDRLDAYLDQEYDFAFGTVNGGVNNNGTYPFTNLKTGEIVFRKCAAQLEFEAAAMPVVALLGSDNLLLTAAHAGKKVLASNAARAINVGFGPDIGRGFSCMVQQYNGKIHFVTTATSVLRIYPAGYEYSAGRWACVSVMVDEVTSGVRQINLAGQLSNIP